MTKNKRKLVVVIGGLCAMALAALLIFAVQQSGGQQKDLTAVPQQGARLGNPDAAVLIEEFSDFQCPFCARFFRETEARLIQEYVTPGKARFVYRHFAFIGPESVWASQAAECAANQGLFWEFHGKLFNNQAGENQGAFSVDRLKRFAQDLGLNRDLFSRCMDANETLDRVRQDTEEAKRLGVRSTPTFFINGAPLLGALPFEEFKAAIESQLAR